MNRDVGVFEYFFNTKFENAKFPNIFVNQIEMSKDTEGYDVEASKILLKVLKRIQISLKVSLDQSLDLIQDIQFNLDEKENTQT